MLDIKYIRGHAAEIKENCARRRVQADIDRLLELDEKRRGELQDIEKLRAERNQGSKGKPDPDEISRLREIGEQIKDLEAGLVPVEAEFTELMAQIPNLTHPESPVGGEDDYRVVATAGEPPQFGFAPQDHETLLTALDLVDFERGAKVAAAKFYFYKNDMVRLNQALLNYGIDIVTAHGFTLMETPDVAKNQVLSGIGFNPRGQETQVYSIENTDLSLIGTAEITVGGYHADEILDLSAGPKKYVALSHCFRTEAGAYGRESKGLYRVHQFTKLEMFIYCRPEESEARHQELLAIEREICDRLELPYRVIDIAAGDLGGPAYRKFDIEAWMTMKNDYGEITSASNCTDYQARRLNIRYRTAAGETEFVHTLNGTAVVLSRFPIAIVENYQQADGTIRVPEVLVKYLGKKVIGV
ncbi:MAG: Serine-tRNA ligase [Candidatus Magasanikbacteria bacterium GW2011_GWA2_56_11]|uniref:Serine--tRNA ligase n=1 Tax=Candidatus Magasanikbacteria bacterium GW2011_GWA2_56_11 TaxID=1619044 RepID=A0A0G2AMH1_9BACT|nr:MAG: Serine-tRNA ligase [Candidatus Magasanikbacteria bacterium GW2011_GWA2_56_11]